MGDSTEVDDVLHRLAMGLEALRPEHAPPAWAEVTGPLADPAAVRWHEGFESMLGFEAPKGCDAVAVVADGWGRGLDSGPPGSISVLAPGERRRVRTVCVVTRDGRIAGHLRAGARLLVEQPPGAGRMLDCLLRCFGLPTAPPATSTDGVLSVLWLASVEHAARARPGQLTWPEVAGLHPAMEALAQAGEAIPLNQVGVALRTAARAWDWCYLLDQARYCGWLADALPPGGAHWMDEGMFARWVVDAWRSADDLLPPLAHLLAPKVLDQVRRTLATLGVGPARSDRISIARPRR